jgi:holo-[acyl-carrier protein] synthase
VSGRSTPGLDLVDLAAPAPDLAAGSAGAASLSRRLRSGALGQGLGVVVGVGFDLIELTAVAQHAHRPTYRRQLCDPTEEAASLRAPDPTLDLAARFALKEACMKALGEGIGQGVGFRQIEVRADAKGLPTLTLRRRALTRFEQLGADRIVAAVGVHRGTALALVLIERAANPVPGSPRRGRG